MLNYYSYKLKAHVCHVSYKAQKTPYSFQRIYITVGAGPGDTMGKEEWSKDEGGREKSQKSQTRGVYAWINEDGSVT